MCHQAYTYLFLFLGGKDEERNTNFKERINRM